MFEVIELKNHFTTEFKAGFQFLKSYKLRSVTLL